MNTADIRQRFLDFFAARGHTIVPSAPLVYNDPTLLFVNAGMVPFKPYFTGAEDAPFARAASVQKCVRTLDIEEVGKTTRHGTFFQMNGNFSFGDYFKEGAIELRLGAGHRLARPTATTASTPTRSGSPSTSTTTRQRELWRKVGHPRRAHPAPRAEGQLLAHGHPRPGRPVQRDLHRPRARAFGPDGGPIVDEDRFLEIWNLVFQTEELSAVRAKDDFDVAAPAAAAKNIDTGMGLERTAYLLQGVANMYEIDEIFPVITPRRRAGRHPLRRGPRRPTSGCGSSATTSARR